MNTAVKGIRPETPRNGKNWYFSTEKRRTRANSPENRRAAQQKFWNVYEE